MLEPALAPPTRLLRHRSFVRFWCARTFTNGAFMMQGVAVGWQMYDLTNDPLDLGLVGLVQFFPLIVTSIAAGQILDLFDRRAIAAACQVGKALAALALAVGTAQGWLGRDAMFARVRNAWHDSRKSLLNWVGSTLNTEWGSLPWCFASSGLWSKESTCDGPPSMYRKMTLFAVAGWCWTG